MNKAPVIVWFRLDLRLGDHAALFAATDTGRPVIPLFTYADRDEDDRPFGGGSRAWLRRSLPALERELEKKASRLIFRRGSALETIPALVEETGATAVFWNERVEPAAREVSDRLSARLRDLGVERHLHPAPWLHMPGEIVTGQGTMYRVFTPFSKACFATDEPPPPLPVPRKWTSPSRWPESDTLEDLLPQRGSEPSPPAWTRPGSRGAALRLQHFLDGYLEDYPEARDRIDADGTSALSPHLHFGEMTAREIWHKVRGAVDGRSSPPKQKAAHAFLRQVLWREFAMLTLLENPEMGWRPIDRKFEDFGWREDAKGLKAWKEGQTGYPIVDAAMRELNETGWMHNRLRMVVASFLCKHLLVHWTEGERWFWEKLLDADHANNTFGWQWVAGCGLDAAPFIRVFNPILQGKRFDPEGAYVARWLPQLEPLGPKSIHEPWAAPDMELRMAGLTLGDDYPEPIVDHRGARTRALMAFETMRS